jgi:hypothetical protein
MATVFCTCKSHCTTYNQGTGTYYGGDFVTKIVAHRHRLDDNRSATLHDSTDHASSSILNDTPGPELLRPCTDAPILSSQIAALPAEVTTLEGEIRDRISWTATARPLVFAVDPVPDVEFKSPLASPRYIPNHGPQALNPSNHNNVAFIENESRLYEIVGSLRMGVFAVDQELLDDLLEKVSTGQYRMMEHKRCEWERQRSRSRAIEKGYIVVNTGKIYKES